MGDDEGAPNREVLRFLRFQKSEVAQSFIRFHLISEDGHA